MSTATDEYEEVKRSVELLCGREEIQVVVDS